MSGKLVGDVLLTAAKRDGDEGASDFCIMEQGWLGLGLMLCILFDC